MNTYFIKSTGILIHFNAKCLVVFVQFLLFFTMSNSVFAKEVILADWAQPLQHLLPHISKEIISEVDDLWTILNDERHCGDDSGFRPDDAFWKAARRMVELREQGEQALIWQYLKKYDPKPDSRSNLNSERQILGALRNSSEIAPLLLPLVRARIKGFENIIKNSTDYRESDSASIMIECNQSYLFYQGNIEDIKSYHDFNISLSSKRGAPIDKATQEQDWKDEVESFESLKDSRKASSEPYWEQLADLLISKKILDPEDLSLKMPEVKTSPIKVPEK